MLEVPTSEGRFTAMVLRCGTLNTKSSFYTESSLLKLLVIFETPSEMVAGS